MWRWSPHLQRWSPHGWRFLHVCGGDPKILRSWYVLHMFSPRMWRWSCLAFITIRILVVFSTYVEVIPILSNFRGWGWSFLHVCGGDPGRRACLTLQTAFSPRMWRWSQDEKNYDVLVNVFSTYVEVILESRTIHQWCLGFLHVCGGDPHMYLHGYHFATVFSTYVEVILDLFCHGKR